MSYKEFKDYYSFKRTAWSRYGLNKPTDASMSSSFVTTSVINGANVPKRFDLIAKGLNATGSLVRTQYSSKVVDFRTYMVGKSGTSQAPYKCETYTHGIHAIHPVYLNNSNYWDKALAEAESTALVAIRNKIRNAQASFGGMTFLAELRQTINGLRNPGKALVRELSSLSENVSLHNKTKLLGGYTRTTSKGRRVERIIAKNRKNARDAVLRDRSRLATGRTFAETWLEFAFGWTPLVNDVKGIAEGLTRYFWKDSMLRAFGSGSGEQATLTHGDNVSASIYCSISTQTVTKVRVKYSAGIKRTLTGPKGQIQQLLGEAGSVNDIAPAIWEVIPWSFLIDYVSNIGDIINAATQSMCGVSWISKTTIIEVTQVTTSVPYDRKDFIIETRGQSTATAKFTKVIRTSVNPADLGIPDLRFTLPSPSQLFNVAALLRTFLRN